MSDTANPGAADQRPAPVPIRPAASPESPPRAALPSSGAEPHRPFINEALNSRLAVKLPAGAWHKRWDAALERDFPYKHIMQSKDRILLQGARRWRLLDRNGKSLKVEALGPSEAIMDPENAQLLLGDRLGFIEARRYSDGTKAFDFSANGIENYERVFLTRRGNRVIIASFERPMNPHPIAPPNTSVIELHDLGNPPHVEENVLASDKTLVTHRFEAPRITAAAQGEAVVFAVKNAIYLADRNLRIVHALGGSFDPWAMSLDENGRIHLIVMEDGKYFVWKLNPRGERLFAVEFDKPLLPLPPVVDYDHRVFVAAADEVMALSPSGGILWRQKMEGRVAGMTATTDDYLLVAAGNTVWAFNAKGERRSLAAFEGESLTAAPILTATGELLAATAEHLYALEAGR